MWPRGLCCEAPTLQAAVDQGSQPAERRTYAAVLAVDRCKAACIRVESGLTIEALSLPGLPGPSGPGHRPKPRPSECRRGIVGVNGGERDSDGVDGAGGLLERFLANRSDRTLKAYTTDLEEFARSRDQLLAGAIAQLLAGGPIAARRSVLDYVIDLRRRGSAPATINRRLATLRSLVRAAQESGMIDWWLEVPSEEQLSVAIESQASSENVRYLLPRHPGEIDRLDIQHYALRETMGANFLAPVESPLRLLDVGCGTGQWGFEACHQFPEALVLGLDLVAGKPDRPPRYHWVKAN